MNLPLILLFTLLTLSYSFNCQTGLCSPPTCPNGYYFNGSTCLQHQSPPIGFPPKSSFSSPCPPGSQWINNNCIGSQQQPQTTYSCPDGYLFNGTDCILLHSNNGRIGTTFAKDLRSQIQNVITGSIGSASIGLKDSGINCPTGSYFNGVTCVASSGNCPVGYVWNGLACVTSQQTMASPSYTPYPPTNINAGVSSYPSINTSPLIQSYAPTTNINYPGIQTQPQTQFYNQPVTNPNNFIPASPPSYIPPQSNPIYQSSVSLPSFYPPNYPTCPSGSSWNGNSCYGTNGIVCPPNSHWNNFACVSTGGVTCNQGLVWNGFSCGIQNNCPFGYQWNGDSCITTTLYCPPGCSNSGSGCSPSILPCPQNTYWSGSNCLPTNGQCATGYSWNGNSCIFIGSQIFNCLPGYNWNGLACIQDTYTIQSCQTGYYFNGLHCIYLPPQTTNPICSTGWYFHPSSACCLQLPINSLKCSNNQYWNGNSCGNAFGGQYTCSSGYAWNGMVCVSYPIQFQCDIGKYWNGRSCVNTESKCLKICGEAGSYYNGFRCVQLIGGNKGGWSTFATNSESGIVPLGVNTCQKGFFWYPILKSCVIQKI